MLIEHLIVVLAYFAIALVFASFCVFKPVEEKIFAAMMQSIHVLVAEELFHLINLVKIKKKNFKMDV